MSAPVLQARIDARTLQGKIVQFERDGERVVAERVDRHLLALFESAPAVLAAAEGVLASRRDGTFGPDGVHGFDLLEAAVARARGQ